MSARIKNTPNDGYILFALLLLNTAVKGWFIGQNSLSGDEPFSVYHAQMEVADIVRLLSTGNNPPLYEILLHYWIKLFGISELSVRMPSLIFSSISAMYIFLLGKKYLTRNIALFSTAIFIFSNYHITLSHESRVYAFLGTLTLISLHTYLSILSSAIKAERGQFYGRFLFLGCINSLLIYGHYFGFIVLIFQGLYALFNFRIFKPYWREICLTVLIILLAYIPNLSVVIHRFSDSQSGTWIPVPNGFDSLFWMLVVFCNAPITTVMVLFVFLASIWKIVRLFFSKNKSDSAKIKLFMFMWFWVIVLSMFLVSFRMSIFLDRYLMVGAILLPLAIGVAIDQWAKYPKLQLLMGSTLVLFFVFTCKPDMANRSEIRSAVELLKEKKSAETVVFVCPDWMDLNVAYYYNRNSFENYNAIDIKHNIHQFLKKDNVFPIANDSLIPKVLSKNVRHVLFLDNVSNFHYPQNNVEQTLRKEFNTVNRFDFHGGLQLLEFKRE